MLNQIKTESSNCLTKYLDRIKIFLIDRECVGVKTCYITSGVERKWFHISSMVKKIIYISCFLNSSVRPSFSKAD